MKWATAWHSSAIVLAIGLSQLAYAENYTASVRGSSEHALGSAACEEAFIQAETEAFDQLDEHFDADDQSFAVKLIAQKETRTVRDNNKVVCVFEGTWEGKPLEKVTDLIGTEQVIEGSYTGSCLDEGNGDICWQRIVRQAKSDLYDNLAENHSNLDDIRLNYLDFEGRQRDQYRQKRLEMSADGRFYFEVVSQESAINESRISIHRHDERNQDAVNEPPSKEETPKPKKSPRKDDIDFTVFYAWDGNDAAMHDDIAISSDRWGVGLWAANRIGFSVFQGTDRLGIANENGSVKNASGTYETLGVGMGFRLWNTRGVTLENMLYYVDAQPYSANVNPSCSSCTARSFESDDYLQATVNLKTNSQGVNVGWMFTWKVLENEPNLDNLSSGFYLEVQF